MTIFNGGRIGSNNVPFTGTKIDDPNYSSVSLLLNGNGTNGSTIFTDSSSNSHTVTPVGNAQISTAQSKFGGASMYFDGSGDYLEIPSSTEFDLGFGAFTVEAWIYLTANGTTASNETYWPIVNKHSIYNTTTSTGNNTAWDFRYNPQQGNKLGFFNRIQASNFTEGVNLFSKYSTAVNLSLNTWYHVAAVRDGTTLKLFLNGQDVTDTNTGNYDWSTINMSLDTGSIGQNKVRVGRILGGSNPGTVIWYAVGYIDDLRITKGVARYTSNFTPPTAQLPGGETGTFASGVWTPREQCDAVRREIWPGFVISIVTDGLVVHLDAGDSASYPGSGTTWTDLSGNGNNATLFGTPSYTASPGYFDITSDSTYARLNSYSHLTNDFTYSMWVRFDAFDGYDTLIENGSWTDVGPLFRVESTTSITVYAEQSGLTGAFTWSPSTNTWYNVVYTRSGSTNTLYVNGTQSGSTFTDQTNISLSNAYTFLMRSQHTTNQFTNGQLAQYAMYNKALTPSEVTQNYNALKGRYGL